jgi:hypothetical protein
MTPATTAGTAPAAPGPPPARAVPVQAHALRAAAVLIEQAGLAGLSLTIDDLITIQVPAHLADPVWRAEAVAVLAAAADGGPPRRDTRPGATRGWIFADGQAAGHAVRIFTAIEQTP